MSAPTTTPSLTLEDFFATTLSSGISASDTVIPVNAAPTSSEGFLVLDQNNSTKEVIYYTSKDASTVTCPSVALGRGQGGTTAVSHSSGATVKMNMVSQYFKEIQNGHAMGLASIGPDKLNTGAAPALVSTSEPTTSSSYGDLTTTTDSVTVVIGANGIAIVNISALGANAASGGQVLMGFAISGATTQAASDAFSAKINSAAGGQSWSLNGTFVLTGLIPGITTFKAKYKSDGTNAATFSNRRIAVVPL